MYPHRHEQLPWSLVPEKSANPGVIQKEGPLIPKEYSLGAMTFTENKIFLAVNEFLAQRELSSEQISSLNTTFHNTVERIRERVMYDFDGKISPTDAQRIARKEALAELEKEVDSLTYAKQEGDERIIPYLLSKHSAQEQITRSLENVNRKQDGKRTVLLTANFDLDGLKGLNDKYDHLLGDMALRYFGAKLHAAVRPGGGANVYHYSGDEFGMSIEMEFPEDMDDEEITLRAKQRMEEIVKEVAKVDDPNKLGRQKNASEEDTAFDEMKRREDIIVRAYDRSPGSAISVRETFIDKFETDSKKFAPNGFQEVSSGFVISFPGGNDTFTSIQKKADHAANVSKLVPYLELVQHNFVTAHVTRPIERMLYGDDIERTMNEYSKEEIERATFLRGISREAKQRAPQVRFAERMRLMMISPLLLEQYAVAVTRQLHADTSEEKTNANEEMGRIWNEALALERRFTTRLSSTL